MRVVRHELAPIAVHLAVYRLASAAAAAVVAEPQRWPMLLLALLLLHTVIALVGLLPRSNWLGANLTRLPPAAVARGEAAVTIDDGPDPVVTPQVPGDSAASWRNRDVLLYRRTRCRPSRTVPHDLPPPGMQSRITASVTASTRRYSAPVAGCAKWARRRQRCVGITGSTPLFYRPIAGLRNRCSNRYCSVCLRLAAGHGAVSIRKTDDPANLC